MGVMVLVYQTVIFLLEVVFKGDRRITLLLGVWTLTHVFMPWLMILQFFVIAFGFVVGRSRQSKDGQTERTKNRNESILSVK